MIERNTMNAPVQILSMGLSVPDLGTSAYGPFVETPTQGLEELAAALDQQAYDAIVLAWDRPGLLADWSGLARAVVEAAVVVVAPEPEVADALRLMRLGVQDVLSRREAATVGTVARTVRLAVERRRIEQAARKAFATDLTTGLPNHAQLMEHMTHLLALREREPAVMALLLVAVDGLAAAEARFGAESANVLRRKVAVRLRSGLRASDVVAALGADSYAVLLAWMDDAADADRVATKLVQSLQRPVSVAGQDMALAVRLGIARYPSQGRDADALLRVALGQAAAAMPQGRIGVASRGGGFAANDD